MPDSTCAAWLQTAGMQRRDGFAPDASMLVRVIAVRLSIVGGVYAIVEGIDALSSTVLHRG